MSKYTFDLCFNVEGTWGSSEDIPAAVLLAAIADRVAHLQANPEEVVEACGFVDCYDEEADGD